MCERHACAVRLGGEGDVDPGPIIVRNDIKQLIVEGNKAFVLYDFVTDTVVGSVLLESS
jgi:hypothetical protein